jgi:hypothetical protein
MGNHRVSCRRVKSRWSYNVREAAKVLGVTPPTVRSWQAKGLKPVEGSKPPFFLGVDIIEFVKSRKASAKDPCGPGRLYCLSCKAPKVPAFGEVEFWPSGPVLGALKGLCPDCTSVMQRRTSRRLLKAAAGNLKVSMQPAESRLIGTAEPCCNPHNPEA